MKSPKLELAFGDVRTKRLKTPNDFISHMVEHIAWRLGCTIELHWPDDDWLQLGRALGTRIGTFSSRVRSAAALGMIDDGSAEVLIRMDGGPDLQIQATACVDRRWFLSSRCEQLSSGRPLVALLKGLSEGLAAEIRIRICSFEDPHHTWEGIFRGVGSALAKLFTPPADPACHATSSGKGPPGGDICVVSRSAQHCEILRHTAESALSVMVDFEDQRPSSFRLEDEALNPRAWMPPIGGLRELLQRVADGAGFHLQATFRSKALCSSHVLLEDTGMLIGRALQEILVRRMMACGVNGAGSSLRRPADFDTQPITVGVSVEGRKFWRFVPLGATFESLRRHMIIGHTVMEGLFTEDLDDFLDGITWGLGASLVVHVRRLLPPEQAWPMIFDHLGEALREVFAANPYRRGVPPGVKANLS